MNRSHAIARWAGVWLALAAATWIGLCSGLGWNAIGWRTVWGMAFLAVLAAAAAVLPALFGGKAAFFISTAGLLVGVLYLAYLVRSVPGWGDLAGVSGFLSVFGIAWVAGLVLQLVLFLVGKIRRTRSKTGRT
ncbi:MAG: hypothetical protein BLM47_09845 [Candidatus Reconcilbacillus cellulovorans]|uniref:Uncharacterized protein n=1 Tax=Candidatus Reconcilbacillus cellulovorans TaxID=1906605 RepID=A0A2A6DZK9_9BACL|nr:MAG: hypothetical protein BLM47_09845 [Candidatus Reconcilbacillus cellulovorans]